MRKNKGSIQVLKCSFDKINMLPPFIDYAIISTVNPDLSLQVSSFTEGIIKQAGLRQTFLNTGIGPALPNLPLKY